MGLLRLWGPPALKAPASFFYSPAVLEEGPEKEGTLCGSSAATPCQVPYSGTCKTSSLLFGNCPLGGAGFPKACPGALSRSTVPCPAGNFLPCRQDHQHQEPQTYVLLRLALVSSSLWRQLTVFLCAGDTDGAAPPPQGCPHQTALQGAGLLSADAAHLTCRGACQGEFSGVCCCAVEAFFLALCPLGRLCAHPAPHCHLYQSGSVT